MKISELVSEVLKEIATGINSAQGQQDSDDRIIVPKHVKTDGRGSTVDQTTGRMVYLVSFELAFLVENSLSKNLDAKGGISVLSVKAGGGSSTSTDMRDQTAQSVKFNIPVLWPSHDGSSKPERKRVKVSELQQQRQQD